MSAGGFAVRRDSSLSSRFLRWTSNQWMRKRQGLFTLGRYALYQGLRILGIGEGDEVLVPAYVCAAVVEAIQAQGAVPVFFRVARDCSHDWADARSRISTRTRALVVVHYFGFAQDLRPAQDLAQQNGLFLIEDCAHILTGTCFGKPLGTMGDISVFSWRKFLPTLDGAALWVNDSCEAIFPKLRPSRLSFELKSLKYLLDPYLTGNVFSRFFSRLAVTIFRLIRSPHSSRNSESPVLETNTSGFDLKLANVAVSRASQFILSHSDVATIVAARRQNYCKLAAKISAIEGVEPLFAVLPADGCPLCFPCLIHGVSAGHRQLRNLGVPATAWDGVRPFGISDQAYPDAGFLYENLVFLPIHQNVREQDLDFMAEMIKIVCQSKKDASTTMVFAGA